MYWTRTAGPSPGESWGNERQRGPHMPRYPSSRLGWGLPARSRPRGPLVEPDVDPRGLPVVGLAQDVGPAVAVQIGDAGLVEAHARLEDRLAEVAPAVAVEDERLGPGVVGVRPPLGPLGHFGDEDVEVAVAVDVRHLERVRVDHRPAHQIMTLPVLRLGGVALALVPLDRTRPVSRGDDHLRNLCVLDEPA